ncbi:MAG: hypothetical protein NZ914_14840 [Gemmatales bacterium]|nr:hypothetical protein [Gemmatales bacterium]
MTKQEMMVTSAALLWLGCGVSCIDYAMEVKPRSKAHTRLLAGAALINDRQGNRCATIDMSGLCLVWDLSNGQVVDNWQLPPFEEPRPKRDPDPAALIFSRVFNAPHFSRVDLITVSNTGQLALVNVGYNAGSPAGTRGTGPVVVRVHELSSGKQLAEFHAIHRPRYDWGVMHPELPLTYPIEIREVCLVRDASTGAVTGFLAESADPVNQGHRMAYVDCTGWPLKKFDLPLQLQKGELLLAARLLGEKLLLVKSAARFVPSRDRLEPVPSIKAPFSLYEWNLSELQKPVVHHLEMEIGPNAYLYAADVARRDNKLHMAALIGEPNLQSPGFLDELTVRLATLAQGTKHFQDIPVRFHHIGNPITHPKVCFVSDGDYLIVDHTVSCVLDLAQGKQLFRLPPLEPPKPEESNEDYVRRIVISPLGKPGYNHVYETVGFLPKESAIIQISHRGQINIWNVREGKLLRSFQVLSHELLQQLYGASESKPRNSGP